MIETRPIRFGRYELLERLGSGGMAVVYRALYTAAPGVSKPVVIKRVLSTFAEHPAFVEMFLNEARISVGLSHGNIVQVFDFGQVDDEYFLAMELVDGHPLARVLKAARQKGLTSLPAPLAVGIALDMCKGLHHAHTRLDARGEPLGVVHRDLSPDNVLLSYEGEVKLTDFGIAKARLAGRPETEVGVVKGKYLYFSPEQARGEPLDARSDVYTVGTVLFQMLCGQRPVEGNSEFEVMRKISEGEVTPALSLNPTLDTDLQGILKLALATSREKRYLSAEALQQSLSDWMGFRAPRFPANARKHFMGWLFQEELTALKRPPQLPSDFLTQLQSWRGRGASVSVPDGAPRAPPSGRPALAVNGDSATRPAVEALPPAPVRGSRPAPSATTAEEPGTAPNPASLRAHLLRRPAGVKAALGALAVTVVCLVGATVFWVTHAREHREVEPAATTAVSGPTAPAKPTAVTASTGAPSAGPSPGTTAAPPTRPAGPTPSAGASKEPSPPETHPPEDPARLALENGLYWTSRADDTRAMGWYQQCLRLDTSQPRCHLELARIYARRGAIRDAMKHFTHHLALEPEGPSAEEARRYLKLYATSDPP